MQHIDATRVGTVFDAYLAARYRVLLGVDWVPLHVGACPPGSLWQALGARRFGIVTAFNPGSVAAPPEDNARADAALHAAIVAHGALPLRTRASAADGSWPEPGWLVPGLTPAALDALARRFGQLGTLHATAGAPLRLRMDAARPPDTPPHPHVDWLQGP